MLTNGYKQSQRDHKLFIKHSKIGGVTALLVYVDDIIVTGNEEQKKEDLKHKLTTKFEIKELEGFKYFLGIEVVHSKHRIFISQQKYILDLLKDTRQSASKPTSTPIESNHKLREAEGNIELIKRCISDWLVSSFISLIHGQILHMLTPGKGILYRRNASLSPEAYIDADYAGSIADRRSTSGYCTFLSGNLAQLADVLTKGLSNPMFQAIITKLGMDNTYSPA
ncbi:uncharacterized protein LOC111378236 [Olea europaea var. sylvestris]|uniref:uncharacterized protein LOC111378236 n=1 Tax=Olea europaea var. sylvestris TaxID=158386 RepID=UPI000C1CDEFC|nr:uncharacterized protein LOC111378236 [Olea europaea var. sylvestris]